MVTSKGVEDPYYSSNPPLSEGREKGRRPLKGGREKGILLSCACSSVDRALVSGTKGRGFESRQARISPLWNFEESSLVSLLSHPTTRGCVKPAKVCMVCFSLFVQFALFAVQDSKTECPLYFRRENHRETRENRESSYDLFLCVRTVPVVRGSCF